MVELNGMVGNQLELELWEYKTDHSWMIVNIKAKPLLSTRVVADLYNLIAILIDFEIFAPSR